LVPNPLQPASGPLKPFTGAIGQATIQRYVQYLPYPYLFGGRIDTVQKMRRYYQAMGPLYSRKFDPIAFGLALERGILSPEALNRAHGPGGYLRSFDLRSELSGIKAPTLILAGRHDWICAPEFAEEIHELIPQSDLRIFEDSSHSIAGDEPQNFFDAVAGFLIYTRRAADTK
jgi:proline iminopeptidase